MSTPSRSRLGRAGFAALLSCTVTIAVLQTMVIPLLPGLRDQLHVSTSAVSWVLTVNFMAASVCAPFLGRLGDMFGKRRALAGAMALLCAGCILCATTTSFPLMLVGRILQGSAQAVFPLSMSIVADEWDAVRRRVGIGWLSASLAIGAALGTVAAGIITQVVHDYHVVFWAATVASVGAGVAVMLTVPPSPSESRGRVDVAGAALMTAWLTVFLLGVAQLGQRSFADVQSLGLVAVGVALLLAWLWLERRVRPPLVDPRQLFMPSVLSANLMAFFIGFGVYGPLFLVTELAQTSTASGYGFGLTVLQTGLIMLPGTVGSFVGSQFAGHAPIAARTMVQIGAVVLAVSLVGTALWHATLWQLILFNAIGGIGGALGFTCLPAIIIDAVPASDTGVATGINTIMRTISGSVAGAVLGGLLGSGRTPADTAYLAAFMLCGVVAAAALPLSALGRRAGEKPLAAPAPAAVTARR